MPLTGNSYTTIPVCPWQRGKTFTRAVVAISTATFFRSRIKSPAATSRRVFEPHLICLPGYQRQTRHRLGISYGKKYIVLRIICIKIGRVWIKSVEKEHATINKGKVSLFDRVAPSHCFTFSDQETAWCRLRIIYLLQSILSSSIYKNNHAPVVVFIPTCRYTEF